MRFSLLTPLLPIAFSLGTLVGCTTPPGAVTESPAASPASSPEASLEASLTSPGSIAPSASALSTVISSQGIGAARLGMTLGELKQTLGDQATFEAKAPFMVDFDAIAVSYAGEVQFYILHMAGQPFSDSDVIQGLMTDNPNYRTAEGIGSGSTIRQAEAAYGKAVLAYNTSNESREYARFQRHPANNISFGTGNGNAAETTAGIYSSPRGEYNETQQYREDATIQSVLVVCLGEGCAQ